MKQHYRVGKYSGRSILDANGHLVCMVEKGYDEPSENAKLEMAQKICDLLNEDARRQYKRERFSDAVNHLESVLEKETIESLNAWLDHFNKDREKGLGLENEQRKPNWFQKVFGVKPRKKVKSCKVNYRRRLLDSEI